MSLIDQTKNALCRSLLSGISAIAAITLLSCQLAIAETQAADEGGTHITGDSIESLISQLDSPSFETREAATEELIKLGPEILKPLTVHFFESSSEAGWRIHRILEGIGQYGNEEDFLRSVAIIQLLFGAQDAQSQKRLAELQFQWKITRREESAKKLRSKGFSFQSNAAPQNRGAMAEMARIEMMVRAAELRDLGGIRIATGPEPVENETQAEASTPQWQDPRKDRQNSILKIEKILAANAEENRVTVDGLLPNQLQVVLPPGSLEVPNNWVADEESLKLINNLGSLSTLKLQNQKIDIRLRDFISKQRTLNGLELVNCEFDDSDQKLTLPRSLKSIRFEGAIPPTDSLKSLRQITTMKLKDIDVDEKTATALSRCKIQMLELEEVKFNRESIQRLVGMNGLFRVTMTLCQFELEWLEKARKINPNLIQAAPKAFLGVQGPVDGVRIQQDQLGCQISQVVSDTAAAKAGLQPLDIVIAMDGIEISRFGDLRLLISQKRPGESMKLRVRRQEKEIDIVVKLGELDS